MKSPEYFSLIIAPQRMHMAGAAWVKYVIALVFVALMALFATSPVTEAPSAYDKPLPMPEDLEPPVGRAVN